MLQKMNNIIPHILSGSCHDLKMKKKHMRSCFYTENIRCEALILLHNNHKMWNPTSSPLEDENYYKQYKKYLSMQC